MTQPTSESSPEPTGIEAEYASPEQESIYGGRAEPAAEPQPEWTTAARMKKKKHRAGLRVLSLDSVRRTESTSDKKETSISEELLFNLS